ncbi:WLM domain-containing protein [Lophiostoma macrostomum CBS 122681]|uniref:WLM domain-containing protein n=1 Tax=Lophiostoma macrostomum CBS 122681 TaxID=1314788 RepID=A0A6A6TDN0_9PLEO|nr:WLM domain-containing protein [Lophiostoma macrostomum CBS 122681]
MPLGFERINERTQRPNALINFIKPLPGPTAAIAEGILSRVAAVCYPFMKSHAILVQALEEFPYNTEFVGRNFNAGEVIQLVLRNRQGEWLPEKWVAMVMVHELAHCKQMNHSKAFWKVRDEYAVELRALWVKGYTGEGLWGRGRDLDSGRIQSGSVAVGDVPEHLCGGTYGRRRKRRRGKKEKKGLSYAERKQRRILKKFGAAGQALGNNEETKVKLEGGVKKKSKPRVAKSARGRELRAAAALARFEPVKKEEVTIKQKESESETEDDYEDAGADEAAIDVDGKKIVDDKGRALIKICEDEDGRDDNARREMDEIHDLETESLRSKEKPVQSPKVSGPAEAPRIPESTPKPADSGHVLHLDEIYKRRPQAPAPKKPIPKSANNAAAPAACSVCSLMNEPGPVTCAACSNVLNPRLVPDHWKCKSSTCVGSQYANAGDAGLCGVCGTPRGL